MAENLTNGELAQHLFKVTINQKFAKKLKETGVLPFITAGSEHAMRCLMAWKVKRENEKTRLMRKMMREMKVQCREKAKKNIESYPEWKDWNKKKVRDTQRGLVVEKQIEKKKKEGEEYIEYPDPEIKQEIKQELCLEKMELNRNREEYIEYPDPETKQEIKQEINQEIKQEINQEIKQEIKIEQF